MTQKFKTEKQRSRRDAEFELRSIRRIPRSFDERAPSFFPLDTQLNSVNFAVTKKRRLSQSDRISARPSDDWRAKRAE